jgi:glycine/D-amino acid oxidase-like deaminating enzyme
VHVVGLEASTIGAGASSRTGGMVLEGTAAGSLERVENCLARLADVTSAAGIDCDLELPGCAQVRHVRHAAAGQRVWRDGETWIVTSGNEPGGTIDPGKLVSGLCSAAQSAGAEIHAHTAARAIESDGSGYRVRVDAGETHADRVVVLVNAYTTLLLDLPVDMHNALTMALCTAPLEQSALEAIGLADGVPFYTVDMPYLWGRRLPDRRLVIGAGLAFAEDGDVRGVSVQRRDVAETIGRLEARVRGLHPALAEVVQPVLRSKGRVEIRTQRFPLVRIEQQQPAIRQPHMIQSRFEMNGCCQPRPAHLGGIQHLRRADLRDGKIRKSVRSYVMSQPAAPVAQLLATVREAQQRVEAGKIDGRRQPAGRGFFRQVEVGENQRETLHGGIVANR